jgi:hypothetical protein
MDENDDPINFAYLVKEQYPGLLKFFKSQETPAKYMEEMVEFVPDGVIEGIMQQIWEFVEERVNDVLTDWEASDDYYHTWLKEQGYVNEEGDVNWDDAPSYTEYNDEARRWISDIEEFVNVSPRHLREIVRDQVGDGTFDEDSIYNIESYIAENLRREMRKENDGDIARWMDKNIHIRRGMYGPVVELKRSNIR